MNAIFRPVASDRLAHAAAIVLSVLLGLMWLIASITVPFEPTDQPIQANVAQAPDRPAAPSSAAARTSADYWSVFGKAAGAF
jgi:hypothetical protein